MKEFLETTLGRILLGVVVLLIWGVNAFNFSKLAGDEALTASTANDEFSEIYIPTKASYNYTGIGRDPFHRTNQIQSSRFQDEAEDNAQYRPEIILQGIFGNTAMLIINNAEPVFIKPGQFLEDDILLKRIFTDSIHIEIGDEQITLTINE